MHFLGHAVGGRNEKAPKRHEAHVLIGVRYVPSINLVVQWTMSVDPPWIPVMTGNHPGEVPTIIARL